MIGGAAHTDEVRVNTLHHTASHCNTLQHTATHCNSTLQRKTQATAEYTAVARADCNSTATRSYTHRLGIAATRCKNKNAGNKTARIGLESLQHTATHCNALQHYNAL